MLNRLRLLNVEEYAAELVFFLFKISESLLEPSLGLYIYQCVCLDHDRSTDNAAEACANLSSYPERETLVQQEAASWMIAHKVLLNFPAIVVGLFCGAWSDVIGRRIPVFLTLGASLIAGMLYLFSLVPSGPTGQQSALALLLVGAAVRGSVGKSAVITMALYSYICDIAPRAQRTQKIGRLMSMNYFGFFVGSMTAGGLLEFHGFHVIFSAVLVIQVACAAVAMRFLKTSEQVAAARMEAEDFNNVAADHSGPSSGDVVKPVGEKMQLQAESLSSPMPSRFPFRLSYVRDSVAVLARSRPNHDRYHVIALFATLFIIQTCRAGEMEAILLFAERSPLSWKKSMYGYLLATDYAGLGISTLFILPFLIRLLHLADMTMVLFPHPTPSPG